LTDLFTAHHLTEIFRRYDNVAAYVTLTLWLQCRLLQFMSCTTCVQLV